MLLLAAHPCRARLRLALLALFVACTGCQTATRSLFTVSGPGWRVQEGQALWRPRRDRPEVGGDLVFATHEDGRCWIEFVKAPLPMASAQITRTNWLIQFPAAEMRFMGRQRPPPRFALLYLPTALAGAKLPPRLRFERKPDGSWCLENTRSGERLTGYLVP